VPAAVAQSIVLQTKRRRRVVAGLSKHARPIPAAKPIDWTVVHYRFLLRSGNGGGDPPFVLSGSRQSCCSLFFPLRHIFLFFFANNHDFLARSRRGAARDMSVVLP